MEKVEKRTSGSESSDGDSSLKLWQGKMWLVDHRRVQTKVVVLEGTVGLRQYRPGLKQPLRRKTLRRPCLPEWRCLLRCRERARFDSRVRRGRQDRRLRLRLKLKLEKEDQCLRSCTSNPSCTNFDYG